MRKCFAWEYRPPYHLILASQVRIGVETGTTGELLARQRFSATAVHAVATLEHTVRALAAKQVEVVPHDSPSILWMTKKHVAERVVQVAGLFTNESLAWALHKDNTALLEAANAALLKWRASGQLEQVINRWIAE